MSEAGTSLNSILVNLIGTTKKTSAALETMGVKAYDSKGEFRGVETILKECSKAMENMTDKQKDQISAALGGKCFATIIRKLIISNRSKTKKAKSISRYANIVVINRIKELLTP